MAKLVLHVGMHKTGSSALQTTLAGYSGDDFIYPQLGGNGSKPHHTDALAHLFTGHRRVFATRRAEFAGKSFDADDEDGQRIKDAAKGAHDRRVILSSEGAYVSLNIKDLRALKQFADQVFEEVRVVAYVREPFSFMSARLETSIKGARCAEFKLIYKPYRVLEKFDRVFGRNKVQLFAYSRDNFPDRDVVSHFCGILGLRPRHSMEVNASMSRPAVSAMFHLNRIIGDTEDEGVVKSLRELRKAIVHRFPHQHWPKFRLAPELISPLIEENIDDMTWIQERLGCPLTGEKQPQCTDVRGEKDLLDIHSDALAQLEDIAQTLSEPARRLFEHAFASRSTKLAHSPA